MAQPSLADLTAAAAAATGPSFPTATPPKLGGVDPLGLRQLNFDLMDQVLPGLNNVARHIRPFVVVAWSWRRAKAIASSSGAKKMPVDDLRDFVDRIEVIYAWSQFLGDQNADLPGRQYLAPILKADRYVFGGPAWRKRREERQYSTAFTAPINYGPGLKMLGWVAPHHEYPEALIATPGAEPALGAFEAAIVDRLDHPAFSRFGEVTVTAKEAARWSEAWAWDKPTDAESRTMAKMLFGIGAPLKRRAAGDLMLAAASFASSRNADLVRATMTGRPSNFAPPEDLSVPLVAWRRLQVRQLFRLALEALLYWIQEQIKDAPKSTGDLIATFLKQIPGRSGHKSARGWLNVGYVAAAAPTALMARITSAMNDTASKDLAEAIIDSLAFSLAEAPETAEPFDRPDRLPLRRARREADAWGDGSPYDFVRHVIQSWVLAQHVYWSVGRGLADARARGKSILRLKVVLEEGGWTLAPGVEVAGQPEPTADRLATALSLAYESGLLDALPG